MKITKFLEFFRKITIKTVVFSNSAFMNNLIELRRDAKKYTKYTQRPVPERVRSIGIWQPIFIFMAHLSILTNVS